MNKIYKVVWNTVRNCYVVGSELISSKSGRHSTSNGKSSSLKVTLTVLALCGMTALGSGVAPAYAANAGTAVESQYVAVHVNDSNNSRRNYRTFDGHSYHKETVSGETYWVRDGYTIKYEANKRYPNAQKDNIIKAYKTSSYTTASDEGLLKSNQIMIESAGISTLTGVDLDNVSGGTYVGATNSGSTSTPSSFNYMIKDDNGTYVDAGNTNFSKRFKAATKNTDGTYSYNGEVIANDNLYVVNEQVGVFLTSSGKVYTGKVFGANNEVLMTTKSDEGTMYSYWGADTPDPNTKLADMTIGQFNQALEKVNNNSKAVAGDTIKEIKTTAKTDGGTIDLVRRGQYNSATGQYEGEHKVGSGITITSRGGTNGEDVKINFSNGTPGFDVAAGSKVEAVKATESATDITGLKINGKTYNIKTGTTEVKGGTNIASVTKTPGSNGNDVYTVNAKGTTVSTDDNFVLDTTTNAENNVTNYGLSLANRITIGKGENSRPIVIDGNKGEITGLTNKTLDVEGFATKGRAATEEQLSAMQSGLTAADKYVTSGTIDKTKGTMKLTVANVTEPVSITGLTDYQVTKDGSSYDAANHRLTLKLKDTMNTSNPAQSVTFDGIASTTDVAKATTEVKGGTNIASVTKTPGSNGNDVYTVNAKGTTVSTDDNFVLDTTTNAENNVTNYGLSLANRITIGKGENSRPIVIDGNKGEITGLTNTGLNATDFAKVGRAATEEQLKEVDSKATAAKTTVIAGKNIEVKGQSGANGSAYTVALADDVSLGNNAAIQLKGSDGSISATSDTSSLNFNDKGLSLSNGKDSTVINGGTITVNGGDSVISGTQATFGKIKLNDESGSTITGLTNTTTDYTGFATAGRAATEEQLKEVAGQAGKAIETAGQGWNLTTNGKDASKTNIKPGDKVDFSSKNDNLLISNDGADLSFSLSNNLDLTENDSKKGSVKVGENTTLTDGLLRVGTDVSLTASALNVGKSSLTTSALTVGGSTYINSSGINANGNRITGVAAGIEPMDAVNVSQLYKTNQAVNNNTENINSLSHSLNKLDSRINRVGAGAAALAALHPLDFDPDNKWDFAAGYGNYAGANAVAIGTYYRPNENTMFSIGGSFGGGENMINAGVSFKLGSGGSGITTSKTVMAKKIKEQDELLKAQDAKMKEQDEKIAKLEALVAQQGEMIQQALGKK